MKKVNQSVVNKFSVIADIIKRRKLLSIIIAAACVALVGFLVFRGAGKAAGDFTVETVQKGSVTNTIAASGTVEPVSTVQLGFKNAEIIKSISVKVGDHVTAGQLLAQLETDNLQAAVNQAAASLKSAQAKMDSLRRGPTPEDLSKAQSDVDMAQASYDQAKTSLDQNKSLYAAGAISKSDLDSANLNFVNAQGKLNQMQATLKTLQQGSLPEDIAAGESQLESSSAQLQSAQSDLAGADMTSPIDGIVSAVNGAVGQRATANNNNTSGGGFITVISEALQVRAQVNEADIGKTQLGQKVEFTVDSYPDKTFNGTVSSISPQAYAVSNVQIYDTIIVPDQNYSELKAGMPANVSIIVARQENVLTVQKGAVSFAVNYMSKLAASGRTSGTGRGGQYGSKSSGQSSSQNSGQSSGQNGGQLSVQNGQDQGSAQGNDQAANPKQQRAVVLVMDSTGKPVPRRVVLGISDMRYYEVVSGLKEGEKVVLGSASAAASGTASGQAAGGGQQRSGGMIFMGGGRAGH